MQVGRVSRQTPVAPTWGQAQRHVLLHEELPRRTPGGAEMLPPSQRRRGQQPKRPRRQRGQPLSPHARLAPRGRSAPCCASRYLPSPLTRLSPEETQRAEGRRTREAKLGFREESKDTHERSAAVAASGRRKETNSAQDSLGEPTAEAPIWRDF